MDEALNVLMGWLHTTAAVTLIGGLLYARLALAPCLQRLSPEQRATLEEKTAACFRPLVYGAIAALAVSGLFSLLTHPGHSLRYFILLGIKLLLALHVFAAAILIVRKNNPRRTRMLTGTAISGLIILLIAAYLRRIF